MRSAYQTQPETADRILEEAERLFRTYGYRKTTMADIAEACEMSPANVYRFFESKSAVHHAITAVVLKRMEDLAQAIVEAPRRVAERLRRLIIESHRFSCEQYLQDVKVHEIVTKAMDEQWPVVDAHIETMRLMFRTLLEEGGRSGEFSSSNLEVRAQCLFNAVIPFCHPQIVAERFVGDRGRQAAQMADFLISALKAAP